LYSTSIFVAHFTTYQYINLFFTPTHVHTQGFIHGGEGDIPKRKFLPLPPLFQQMFTHLSKHFSTQAKVPLQFNFAFKFTIGELSKVAYGRKEIIIENEAGQGVGGGKCDFLTS